MVQWLGFCAFTVIIQVQFLVGELRSCKPHGKGSPIPCPLKIRAWKSLTLVPELTPTLAYNSGKVSYLAFYLLHVKSILLVPPKLCLQVRETWQLSHVFIKPWCGALCYKTDTLVKQLLAPTVTDSFLPITALTTWDSSYSPLTCFIGHFQWLGLHSEDPPFANHLLPLSSWPPFLI